MTISQVTDGQTGGPNTMSSVIWGISKGGINKVENLQTYSINKNRELAYRRVREHHPETEANTGRTGGNHGWRHKPCYSTFPGDTAVPNVEK